ncbi:MAG: hypothetical protein M0C28_41505 [Candidatus Moduliflexus flocculans]|nr:hypothetical protein [Candidatus Moduliflexus flocculans]
MRVLSRNNLAAGGRFQDASAAAGAALARRRCLRAGGPRGGGVRLGGDAVFVNGDADDGLYAAARPVYVFSGEYWMESGPAERESPED